MSKHIKKLVFSAMLAALTFCATFVIKIPTPTGGYVHMGDSLVLFSACLLGPVYGALAAAIGSMLSDLVGGYSTYILPTFVIKGAVAIVHYFVFRLLVKKLNHFWSAILSGLCGGVIMVLGYYFTEALFLGYGFAGAAVGIAPNIIQAVFGAVSASFLISIFEKNNHCKKLF